MSSAFRTVFLTALIALVGCSGFTLGPTIEKRTIIVHAGTGIEILDQVTVKAHLLTDDGHDTFEQDIGGWVCLHPDHWDAVKREIARLRHKCHEDDPPPPPTSTEPGH